MATPAAAAAVLRAMHGYRLDGKSIVVKQAGAPGGGPGGGGPGGGGHGGGHGDHHSRLVSRSWHCAGMNNALLYL